MARLAESAEPSPSPAGIPPLAVEVSCGAEDWVRALPDAAERAGIAARAAWAVAHDAAATEAEVSILLTDDETQRRLNREYRGKDSSTNVLSFEGGGAMAQGAPLMLGDMSVAYGTASGEAAAAGSPLDHHLVHLIVHGVLHLLGYDHVMDSEAEAMERLEVDVLAGLGIPDPYQGPEGGPGTAGHQGDR